MRKGTLFTLAAAVSATMCTAIPVLADDTAVYGQVNTWSLNIREGSTRYDEIIGGLYEGDEITVTGETGNGWYEISHNGETAYVYGEYVDIDEDEYLPEVEGITYTDEEASGESYDEYEETGSSDESADEAEASADDASDETGDSSDASAASDEDAADSTDSAWNGPVLTRSAGTVQGPSGKETYYNLDMSGVVNIMRGMGNYDEYWVREDGCKMLGDYIMCAANLDVHPRGSLVESSLGTCIVADTGGFAYSNPYQLDIAVTW